MSVPKSKRGEGNFQLQVLVEARQLCKYVYSITSNEKNFNSCYHTLTTKFVDCVTNIYLYLYNANNVRVVDEITYTIRLQSSYKAYLCCNEALAEIDLLVVCFHLKSGRRSFLVEKILQLRSLIQKWRASEKQRYQQYKVIRLSDEDLLDFVSKNKEDQSNNGDNINDNVNANTDKNTNNQVTNLSEAKELKTKEQREFTLDF